MMRMGDIPDLEVLEMPTGEREGLVREALEKKLVEYEQRIRHPDVVEAHVDSARAKIEIIKLLLGRGCVSRDFVLHDKYVEMVKVYDKAFNVIAAYVLYDGAGVEGGGGWPIETPTP